MTRNRRVLFYALTVLLLLAGVRILDLAFGWLTPQASEYQPPPPSINVEHITDEYQHRVIINSLSLRSPEIPREAGGRKRVFVIGDSFVFGTGVEEEETFTRRAEGILRRNGHDVDLVNLGNVMQSPRTYVERYRSIRAAFKADAILLVMHTNDVMDLDRSEELSALQRYMLRRRRSLRIARFLAPRTTDFLMSQWIRKKVAQALPNEEMVIPAHRADAARRAMADSSAAARRKADADEIRFIWGMGFLAEIYDVPRARFEAWKKSRPDLIRRAARGVISQVVLMAALLKPDFYANCLDIPPDKEALLTELKQQMDAMREEALKDGVRFAVAYVPSENQYDAGKLKMNRELGYTVRDEWLTTTSRLERELDAWAKNRQVPFLNLTEICRRNSGIVFGFDMHFNRKGHSVTTLPVARFVEDHLLADRAKKTDRNVLPDAPRRVHSGPRGLSSGLLP